MSGCELYQELISRRIDGELNTDEKSLLAEHLKTCPDCALLFDAFSALSDTLAEDLAEPPVSLHEEIMAQVRREKIKKTGFWQRLPKSYRSLLAAAACLALIAGFSFSVEHIFPMRMGAGNSSSAAPSAVSGAADNSAPAITTYQAAADAAGSAEAPMMIMELEPEMAVAEDGSNGNAPPPPSPKSSPFPLSAEEEAALFSLLNGTVADSVALSGEPIYLFSLNDGRELAVYVLDEQPYYTNSAEEVVYLAGCTQTDLELFLREAFG